MDLLRKHDFTPVEFEFQEEAEDNGLAFKLAHGSQQDAFFSARFDGTKVRISFYPAKGQIEPIVGQTNHASFALAWESMKPRLEVWLRTLSEEIEAGASTFAKAADQSETETDTEDEMPKPKVFVVHGRNELIRKEFFSFLRALRVDPIEWSEAVQATGKASPYVGEVLNVAFTQAQAVIVLLTPDDEARLSERHWSDSEPEYEKELTGQARPNVLFEAGMAFGRDPERTLLIEIGPRKPFSDVAGRHVVRLDDSAQKRLAVARRLKEAGCEVSLDGDDWLSIGNFLISSPPGT